MGTFLFPPTAFVSSFFFPAAFFMFSFFALFFDSMVGPDGSVSSALTWSPSWPWIRVSFLRSRGKSSTKLRMEVTGPPEPPPGLSGPKSLPDFSGPLDSVMLTDLIFSAFSLTILLGMLEVDWEPEYFSPVAFFLSRLLCPLAGRREAGREFLEARDVLWV